MWCVIVACAGTLAGVAQQRREVESERGGVKPTGCSAYRAHRAVTSRYAQSSAEGCAEGETCAEDRERAVWSEGGAYLKRAEAESCAERRSRRGGETSPEGCVYQERAVCKRGSCAEGETGTEGGANLEKAVWMAMG